MKTKAVRLYGKNDLRLEEFDLPPIREDEILARIWSDSICMSSYKAAIQGADHKRVPNDVADHPVIIGHEFCGELVEVGKAWQKKFRAGQKFTVQPAINYKGRPDSPGYSFSYVGGDATYVILPSCVMETDCLLPYDGESWFCGSLAEPMSCIVGTYHATYHTKNGVYTHEMGIREGGKMAILAGVGPMGLGAIDYALNAPRRPRLLAVTDIDDARLVRAESIFTREFAAERGVELHYVNTASGNAAERLLALAGEGYDDVFVFAPVRPVVEQGDAILARDGCLNFFAGPTDPKFSANFNFYNVHYNQTHIVGTSGGNTDDMRESLAMMGSGALRTEVMITHVGGLDAAAETTLHLPEIKGGKKLIYTQIEMPLCAIEDFGKSDDPVLLALDAICKRHNGLWSAEAERYLLAHARPIG